MTQLQLPLQTFRDRGQLNSLRNILASVSDELRENQAIMEGIIDFLTRQLPRLIQSNTPLDLRSANDKNTSISPYPFEILDFIDDPRPSVYDTVRDLVDNLDIDALSTLIKDVELIGIDESIVDTPLPQSTLSFLKSVAFRIYTNPQGKQDEAIGPILSRLRIQNKEEGAFQNENMLLGYIRNHYVAYISILNSLAVGRTPFTVLHGPLVRAIGPFSGVFFDYKTARSLLNVDLDEAGEVDISLEKISALKGDNATTYNLSFIPLEAIDGNKNLKQFTNFCINQCGRQCAGNKLYEDNNAVPRNNPNITQPMLEGRNYPGFCLYFWVLRSLFDLCRLSKTCVSSVVENVSASTEVSRLVLPSLIANNLQKIFQNSGLAPTLQNINIDFTKQSGRSDLYRSMIKVIKDVNLNDSYIFTYALDEGEYTVPIQIYRYRSMQSNKKLLGDEMGINSQFEPFLDELFPATPTQNHPGYRVLMSYIRTTPLREPIRAEFFDLDHYLPAEKIIGSLYLLSLPYQEYGLPIILYYADKVARTPSILVRTIIEREFFDLVLKGKYSDPISVMSILGRFTRNYFQREGM